MPHHSHPTGVVEVTPGLFIGGIAALDHLQQLHITHVVSVVNEPGSVAHAQLEGRQRHLADVADTEEANLLQHLPAAVAFVAAALGGGAVGSAAAAAAAGPGDSGNRVLLHCAQGVSRSAAVAVAYLMARSPGLEPEAALAALRQKYPAAAPNAGFIRQLELFFAMGCRLAEGYLPYKRFLLEQAAAQYSATGLPSLDAASLSQPQEAAAGADGATLYRCRKCRALVATQHNVVETEQGPGASAFSWRKRDKQQRASLGSDGASASSSTGPEEGSLFVEPLRWMCESGGGPGGDSVVGGAVQGKLYCPKCQARLGSFNWAGTQSSSGAWVTPAFQLHLSKLDAVDPRPPVALAGIRQPRMLGGSSSAAPAAAATVDGLATQLQGAVVSDSPATATAAAAQQGAAAVDGIVDGSSAQGGSSGVNGSSASPFRYLILDCDGVLVDSERASCEALRQAILQVTGFDIPHEFPVDYQPVFGMDVWHCIEYYQQRFGRQDWGDTTSVAQQVSDAKEPIYQRLTAAGIAAFPGVAALVSQARQLGMGVAVASSGSPDKIAHNLGSSGLAHLFPDPHLIVSAKYVQRGKPAPDVYLETLRRLGCTDASQALVVEDAVNGLKAAKAAGCFAVAVCTSLPGHMLAAQADAVVERLADLDLAAVQPAAAQPAPKRLLAATPRAFFSARGPLSIMPSQQPVSLVVGAGPAGVLAAVYLARRGHQVHVFDRRPSPLVTDSSDHRAFFVMLQPRGVAALEGAGFALRPGGGLQQVSGLSTCRGRRHRRVPFQQPRLMGPRHAFVRQMVEQAEAMQLPNLHFYFETAFERVDLASKTATFKTGCAACASSDSGSGSEDCGSGDESSISISFSYDLLVAADGGWSRVRRAAEAQTPELQVSLEQVPGRYKVFRHLPPSPAMQFTPASSSTGANSGSSKGGSSAVQLQVLAATGESAVMFLAPDLDSTSGAACGMMAMNGEAAWERLQTAEDYQAFLARQFPSLPHEWLPEMASQLQPAPLAVAGMRVHASQLHAPNVCFIGDAAHGVTPRTGNGMNAALEDAVVLDQLLENAGEDLASVPAAFTAARLPDARALLWLDSNASERNGTSSWGRLHPLAVASGASMLYRSLLTKATGGWVRPNALAVMNDLGRPYREVQAQVWRDNLLLGTLGLPAAAPVALLAAAAAGADRLRA